MMIYQLVLNFVIVGFFTKQGSASRDELIQLSECICPGYMLTYQCNVVGGSITFWNGSLFECPLNSNQILLRHSEFRQTSASGDCNNEAVIANSISESPTNSSNKCYSSQLTITVSPSMNNKTIECNREDIQQRRVTSIGIRILNFTSEPYPPKVYLRNVDATQLEFSWDPIPVNCPTITYRIVSSTTCGSCPSTTIHTTVTCSNPTINDEMCSLSVQSVICGSILGSVSEPLQVLPKISALVPQLLQLFLVLNMCYTVVNS